MSSIKNVLIIGAGGNAGTPILKSLLETNDFNITVLTRPQSKATFPSSVNVVKSDYSIESFESAFQGQDAVIATVGNGAFDHLKKIVDAAVRAGVKRFIPSEFGIDTKDPEVIEFLPAVFGSKRKVIEYLESKQDEGLSWTAVSTGAFLDWSLETGFLGIDIKSKTATIWDSGETVFTATNVAQIGKAVTRVLQKPEETANRYVYVSSVQTSQKEILDSIERVTGEKWNVVNVNSESKIKELKGKLENGDYSGIFTLVSAAIAAVPLGNLEKAGLNNDLVGLEKESLDETVRRVLL